MRLILALGFILTSSTLFAQGPAGISSNLQLWLSSDVGVYKDAGVTVSTSGDPVQEWHDQSSNAFVLQGTSNARPTLGSDGLDFDGTDDMLTLTGGLLPNATAFNELEIFVVKITDVIKDETVFHQSLSPSHIGACLPCLDNSFAYFEAGDGNFTSGAVFGPWGGSVGTKYIWGMNTDFNGSDSDVPYSKAIYRDGQAIPAGGTNTGTTITGSSNDFTIGNISTGGSRYMNGKIAEIIVYTGVLSETDRATILDYLAAKHQVATSETIRFDGSFTGGSGVSNAPNTTDGVKPFIVTSGNATLTADATVASFSIADGATLTLAPNVSLTVNGESFISGANALVLESDATGTANFIDNGINYKESGSVKVERYLKYAIATFPEGYHYISSPVNNHTKFTDAAALYYYDETSLTWIHESNFTNFTNGVGYAIRYANDITKDFVGELNTGDVNVSITYTDNAGSVYDHFNLIGNPYPSSISADDIVDNNSAVINPTIYLWNGEDYSSYNTTLNAGTAGSIGTTPTAQIAVGQGFYVDAKNASTITLTNSMRGTDSDTFFKKEAFPQLRLLASSTTGKSDILLTGHPASTFDVDDYDSKHLPGEAKLSISALIHNKAFDIQSVPQIDGTTFDLQVISASPTKIQFTLQDVDLKNSFHVYLEDHKMGTVTDITTSTYSTYTTEGTDNKRFKLRIGKETTDMSTWINNGRVITTGKYDEITMIRLITLDGKIVSQSYDMHFNNWNSLPKGIYLLEILSEEKNYIQKIIK